MVFWHWRHNLKSVCCNCSMKKTRQVVRHYIMQAVRATSAVWRILSGLERASTSRTITMKVPCTLQPGESDNGKNSMKLWDIYRHMHCVKNVGCLPKAKWFGCATALCQYFRTDGRLVSEWKVGKDLEVGCHGLMKVPCHHFPGRTEKNYIKPQSG